MTSIKQRIIQALKMSDGSTVKPYEPYPKEWEGIVSAERLHTERFEPSDPLPILWDHKMWNHQIEYAMITGGFREVWMRAGSWTDTKMCERDDVRDYCNRYHAGYRDPKCFLPGVLELNDRFHEAVSTNDVTRAHILNKYIEDLPHDKVFGIATGRFHNDSVYCGPIRDRKYDGL